MSQRENVTDKIYYMCGFIYHILLVLFVLPFVLDRISIRFVND